MRPPAPRGHAVPASVDPSSPAGRILAANAELQRRLRRVRECVARVVSANDQLQESLRRFRVD